MSVCLYVCLSVYIYFYNWTLVAPFVYPSELRLSSVEVNNLHCRLKHTCAMHVEPNQQILVEPKDCDWTKIMDFDWTKWTDSGWTKPSASGRTKPIHSGKTRPVHYCPWLIGGRFLFQCAFHMISNVIAVEGCCGCYFSNHPFIYR